MNRFQYFIYFLVCIFFSACIDKNNNENSKTDSTASAINKDSHRKNLYNDLWSENIKGKVKSITENYYLIDFKNSEENMKNLTTPMKGKLRYSVTFHYNEEGNSTEIISDIKRVHSYDKNGKKTGWINYDNKAKAFETATLTYDTENNVKEIVYRNTNNELIKTRQYKYNSDRKIAEQSITEKGELTFQEQRTYDSLGNVSLSKINTLDDETSTYNYKYNQQGDVIESPNERARYIYEYDPVNNWTRRIKIIKTESADPNAPFIEMQEEITERVIEYY